MEIKTVNWQRPDGVIHVRIMQKECSKCHKTKEAGMFRRRPSATDGRVSECIECERKLSEEIRARKKESQEPVHLKYELRYDGIVEQSDDFDILWKKSLLLRHKSILYCCFQSKMNWTLLDGSEGEPERDIPKVSDTLRKNTYRFCINFYRNVRLKWLSMSLKEDIQKQS